MQGVTGDMSGGFSVTSSSLGMSSSGVTGGLGASGGVSSGGRRGSANALEPRSSSQFVSSSSGDLGSLSVGSINLSGGGAHSSTMSSGGRALSTVLSVGGSSTKYTSSATTSAMKSASYSPVTQRRSSLTLRTAGYEGDLQLVTFGFLILLYWTKLAIVSIQSI